MGIAPELARRSAGRQYLSVPTAITRDQTHVFDSGPIFNRDESVRQQFGSVHSGCALL